MEMTPAEKAEREAWLKKLEKAGKPLGVKRWGEPPPPRASLDSDEDNSPRKQSKKFRPATPRAAAKSKLNKTRQTPSNKGISLLKSPPPRRAPRKSRASSLPKPAPLYSSTPARPQLTPPTSDNRNSSNSDKSSDSSSDSSSHSNFSSDLSDHEKQNTDIVHISDDDDDHGDDDHKVGDNRMLEISCKKPDDDGQLVIDSRERARLLNLMDNLVKIQSDFLHTFKQHLMAFEQTFVSPRSRGEVKFDKLYSYLDNSAKFTKELNLRT